MMSLEREFGNGDENGEERREEYKEVEVLRSNGSMCADL